MTNEKSVRVFLWIWAIICSLLVGYYFIDVPLFGDAGAFAGIAQHIINGAALYKDVFDNKGPGIFILHAIFIKLSGNHSLAIHSMQVLHMAIAGICILRLFAQTQNNLFWITVCMLPWFFMRFTDYYCYFVGHYTEEYACYYIIYSITLLYKSNNQSILKWQAVISGMTLAQTIFLKETFAPMVLLVVIWAIFIHRKQGAGIISQMAIGCMMIMSFYAFWFLINDSFSGYIQYLKFAFGYAENENILGNYMARLSLFVNDWKNIDPKILILGAGFLFTLTDLKYLKENKFMPLLIILLAIASSLSLMVGKIAYGHYFLPMVFFVLLSAIGFTNWVIFKLSNYKQSGLWIKKFIISVGFVFLLLICFNAIKHFTKKADFASNEKQERKIIIKKLKNYNTVFVDPQDAGRFYFYSGKSSGLIHPCSYYVYYLTETAGQFAEKNRQAFYENFIRNPPQCIITEQQYGYGIQYAGLSGIVNDKYNLVDSFTGADSRVYYIKKTNMMPTGSNK